MIALLGKEIRLALHPTAPMFLLLSAMLLIPSYPFYVVFFYTGLTVFFTCLSGRENGDVTYTLMLPVEKRSVVRARMLTVVLLQAMQLLTAVGFAVLRNAVMQPENPAGMDANIAFFALSLGLLGVFNRAFFGMYYRDVNRVGKAFLISSVWVFLYITAAEALVHTAPFFRDVLDTPDPEHIVVKALLLALGMASYAALTALAYRRAAKLFDKQDM